MNTRLYNEEKLEKVLLVSLMLLNSLFLVYWCILAYYSQLHFDDLHFLWKMREMSVFDFVKESYRGQSGRFVVYFTDGVVSVVTDALGFHQLWALLYYGLGIGICWLVVKDIKMPVSRRMLFMGTCFVYNVYVLTNIDFPVFFWICAMMYYLCFPMACLLVKYLNLEKINWWQKILLSIMIVLVGGGNEAFTPIAMLLMFVCGMYWWHSKGWDVKQTWDLPQVRRIVLSAVAMLALYAIVVAAPGNYARMANGVKGGGFVHPIGLWGWIRAEMNAVSGFCYFMVFYIPYYLVAFALSYFWGSKSPKELQLNKAKLVMGLLLGFVVYLLLSALPNVYLYNGIGIQRNYTHVVFALLLTIVLTGYILGEGHESKCSGTFAIVGLMTFAIIMCVNIIKDTPTARSFGKAVDERIEYLCALRDKGQKETVTVAPLPVPYTEDPKHLIMGILGQETPRPVLYYISDTDLEPNNYEYHMKRVLNLDFDFVLTADTNQ